MVVERNRRCSLLFSFPLAPVNWRKKEKQTNKTDKNEMQQQQE